MYECVCVCIILQGNAFDVLFIYEMKMFLCLKIKDLTLSLHFSNQLIMHSKLTQLKNSLTSK